MSRWRITIMSLRPSKNKETMENSTFFSLPISRNSISKISCHGQELYLYRLLCDCCLFAIELMSIELANATNNNVSINPADIWDDLRMKSLTSHFYRLVNDFVYLMKKKTVGICFFPWRKKFRHFNLLQKNQNLLKKIDSTIENW